MDCEVIVSWIQTVSVKNCGSLVFVPKARDVLAAAVSQSPFMGKRVALLKELTVVLKPSVYKHFAAMRRRDVDSPLYQVTTPRPRPRGTLTGDGFRTLYDNRS